MTERNNCDSLLSLLDIPHGVTALIGGGGKTTLMETLADRLPGTVLLCTTTHIVRPDRFPVLLDPSEEAVRAALGQHRAVCVGTLAGSMADTAAETGQPQKLAAPRLPFPVLASLADYVLVEADGSRRLPLKAHAAWEPVIPENAARVVLVVGLDGIGRPVRDVCHRPELYAALAGCTMDEAATPERAARVTVAEGYGDCVYLNKAESAEAVRYGEDLADCLAERFPVPVVCGSLWSGTFRRIR